MGSQKPAPGALESFQLAHRKIGKHSRFSAVQLDGTRRLALHPRGKDPHRSALLRARTPGGRAQPHDRADLLSRRTFAWRKSSMDQVPHAHLIHRSEEHTSELQSRLHLVCRLLLEKKNNIASDSFRPQNFLRLSHITSTLCHSYLAIQYVIVTLCANLLNQFYPNSRLNANDLHSL